MTTCGDIITAVNRYAPLSLQENWDNSGIQVGDVTAECSGVLLCVDPTEQIIDEAVARDCNLVISHHPLLFRGLKSITPATGVQRAVMAAIRSGVTVFSSHTAMDSATGGISAEMARRLGLEAPIPLVPGANDPTTGLGAVARATTPLDAESLVTKIKAVFGNSVVRASRLRPDAITTVAMCGGAGGEFIPDAIACGAQAYITADIRYHDFVDHGDEIFLVDIGHYESECCAKDIFYRIITEKFPNFAVYYSELENNPISYL